MAFNAAHFARMPEAKKPHTLFKRPSTHAGTMMHGDIVPAYCKLCAPGDVIDERILGNIRMSTPLGPIYSSIKVAFNAFFVPLRLIWEHTKEFFGENTTTAGPQTTQYRIPGVWVNNRQNNGSKVLQHSVSQYLGKPLYKGDSLESNDGTSTSLVSCLKERAYWLTVSEYYRMEQVMNPVILAVGDHTVGAVGSTAIGSLDGSVITLGSAPMKCLKDFDYFTTMTRSPQYGPDVVLPLGTTAPVSWQFDSMAAGSYPNITTQGSLVLELDANKKQTAHGIWDMLSTDASVVAKGDLVADLSTATAASIDELYLAMAAQAWYHNANYGSKYFEMLQVHYGVYNPDLVLQRPDHIGEAKRYIAVQQVLATATTTNSGDTTTLGQPGANSSTDIDVKFPRYAVGEWGYYIVLVNTYHERYYSGGIQREDLYADMFDFYFPEFANIGDQGVKEIEAFYTSASNPEDLLGFQEAWAEMRYTPNRLSGLLDPYAESGVNGSANTLKRWTLSEKWSSAPTLSKSFLLENRDAIKDALITGNAGPDYVFYFYFDEKVLSEVPLFSVPGLPGRGRGL